MSVSVREVNELCDDLKRYLSSYEWQRIEMPLGDAEWAFEHGYDYRFEEGMKTVLNQLDRDGEKLAYNMVYDLYRRV